MIDPDADLDLRILQHVAMCNDVAVISGPKALATLRTTLAAVNNVSATDAIKRLHRGGQIATATPYRPRSPVRFILTPKGAAMLGRKVAA